MANRRFFVGSSTSSDVAGPGLVFQASLRGEELRYDPLPDLPDPTVVGGAAVLDSVLYVVSSASNDAQAGQVAAMWMLDLNAEDPEWLAAPAPPSNVREFPRASGAGWSVVLVRGCAAGGASRPAGPTVRTSLHRWIGMDCDCEPAEPAVGDRRAAGRSHSYRPADGGRERHRHFGIPLCHRHVGRPRSSAGTAQQRERCDVGGEPGLHGPGCRREEPRRSDPRGQNPAGVVRLLDHRLHHADRLLRRAGNDGPVFRAPRVQHRGLLPRRQAHALVGDRPVDFRHTAVINQLHGRARQGLLHRLGLLPAPNDHHHGRFPVVFFYLPHFRGRR